MYNEISVEDESEEDSKMEDGEVSGESSHTEYTDLDLDFGEPNREEDKNVFQAAQEDAMMIYRDCKQTKL